MIDTRVEINEYWRSREGAGTVHLYSTVKAGSIWGMKRAKYNHRKKGKNGEEGGVGRVGGRIVD